MDYLLKVSAFLAIEFLCFLWWKKMEGYSNIDSIKVIIIVNAIIAFLILILPILNTIIYKFPIRTGILGLILSVIVLNYMYQKSLKG